MKQVQKLDIPAFAVAKRDAATFLAGMVEAYAASDSGGEKVRLTTGAGKASDGSSKIKIEAGKAATVHRR